MQRQLEIAKYNAAYQNRDYRMGKSRREAVTSVLYTLPKGSLLDVGTGRGETLELAREHGHSPVLGTEVVDYLLNSQVTYAEAHALPFDNGEFDHVTSFDVIEHLTADDVEPALREMFRVAKFSATISAASFSHVYQGVELHPSWRERDEWDMLIRSVWGDAKIVGRASPRSWIWQVLKWQQ